MAGEDEDEATSRLASQAIASLLPPPPPPISASHLHHHHFSTKSNPRLLSFLLKALVMAFVIFLFFIFVGIAAVLLIHICIAGRAFHLRRHRDRTRHRYRYHHRRTTTPFVNDDDSVNSRFSPMDLQRLPCFTVGQLVSPQDCPVCLEGFREGERCRILPRCNHLFHSTCIDTWLGKSSACPVCRGIVSLN